MKVELGFYKIKIMEVYKTTRNGFSSLAFVDESGKVWSAQELADLHNMKRVTIHQRLNKYGIGPLLFYPGWVTPTIRARYNKYQKPWVDCEPVLMTRSGKILKNGSVEDKVKCPPAAKGGIDYLFRNLKEDEDV